MSIKGQRHSLNLAKGHSDFKVMFDFGLYTQVSDSGPHGPLVSSSFTSYWVQLFRTTSAYSRMGRIKVKYIVWRDVLSSLNFNFLLTFIRVHALDLIYSKWSCHVQSLDKKKP